MESNLKVLTTQHNLLITRIRKCMIQDELNHVWRLPYTKKWVDNFLNSIELKGRYQEHQGRILSEIRDEYITELKVQYKSA